MKCLKLRFWIPSFIVIIHIKSRFPSQEPVFHMSMKFHWCGVGTQKLLFTWLFLEQVRICVLWSCKLKGNGKDFRRFSLAWTIKNSKQDDHNPCLQVARTLLFFCSSRWHVKVDLDEVGVLDHFSRKSWEGVSMRKLCWVMLQRRIELF